MSALFPMWAWIRGLIIQKRTTFGCIIVRGVVCCPKGLLGLIAMVINPLPFGLFWPQSEISFMGRGVNMLQQSLLSFIKGSSIKLCVYGPSVRVWRCWLPLLEVDHKWEGGGQRMCCRREDSRKEMNEMVAPLAKWAISVMSVTSPEQVKSVWDSDTVCGK